ncbi:hypothetical protein, conserved [Leishmania tarentolae]|uniref:Uncharacterized protein n=1 Tax=Leishmania tarentolae TaxID=5689 RepID=A0A640KDW4_LEITA|nr:hypothetical protein, conserved [Leishmania tarentolae]
MGCTCAKTKKREGPPEAFPELAEQEVVPEAGAPELDEVFVSRSAHPSATASVSDRRDEKSSRSAEQLPEEAVAEQQAHDAVAAFSAHDDSMYSTQTPLVVSLKPKDDGDTPRSVGVVSHPSTSRTGTPSEQRKLQKEVEKDGSHLDAETESNNTAKAVDEWEVELSQPCSTPPWPQEQQDLAMISPAAVTETPYDAAATAPVAMEGVPQPIPKRESPRSLPNSANGRCASAATSSQAPASAPRRLSRKPSISSSSSVSVQSLRRPSAHNGGTQRATQQGASPASAAPPSHRALPRDKYGAVAAAPVSPVLSPASTSVTPVINKALTPVSQPSERMVAHPCTDTAREPVASPQNRNQSLHPESSTGLRTPLSEKPLRPVSGQWQRGFVSSIPHHQIYTDPKDDATFHQHRMPATYMPPPTAYVMWPDRRGPQRLLFNASTLATIEASTARLTQSYTLRLAGSPNGAAALITDNGPDNRASAFASQRFGAPSTSVPVASRFPTSRADVPESREPKKRQPLSLNDPEYSLAPSTAGVSATAFAPLSTPPGSSYSRSSQRSMLAMSEPRAQQQRDFLGGRHTVAASPEQHMPHYTGVRARSSASKRAKYHDNDADADAPSAGTSYSEVPSSALYAR